MWIEHKVTGGIHQELNDSLNEFNDEINLLRNMKEQEIEKLEILLNDKDYQEYIGIYFLINSRIDEFQNQILNKGMFDYCGKSIKNIIQILEITSTLINQNTDYKELDSTLHVIDRTLKYFKSHSVRSNRKIHLLAVTLFDNFLIENIRVLYKDLSTFDDEAQKKKIMKYGNSSLVDKVKWFIHLNPHLKYSNDNLIIYGALRNAIVHNASIISKRIENYISANLENKNHDNFKEGVVVEIEDHEIMKLLDELALLSKEIYDSVTQKFIMTFQERNYSVMDDLASIQLSEWE
jgi:hypothetical protein